MATLKISDLSVGDWVYYDKGDTPYSIRSVYRTGIQDCVVLNDSVFPEGVIGFVDRLTPIPITAEILEQNGFVKKNYDNGKMWDWWCDNVLVRKFADEDIYRFIVALDSMHYTTMMVVGKHTHQLQHALRLAGVDKEINL